MNSDIIAQGPTEMITGPATIGRKVLRATALTTCAITSLQFEYPATPANADAESALATFPALGLLENVKSFTLTSGTMLVVYRF